MKPLYEKDIIVANRLLKERFGTPKIGFKNKDLIGALIEGVLSQNTSDNNRDKAFARLVEKYSSWNILANAPIKEIEKTISPAGMMHLRAHRIKSLMNNIRERSGDFDASFLLKEHHRKAFEWLISQDGIGEKTAAVFLLFARNAPYFPVDTHIARILPRLGWFPQITPPIKIQREMTKLCPHSLMKIFHLNLLILGRTICKPRSPKCPECPLKELCDYFTIDK